MFIGLTTYVYVDSRDVEKPLGSVCCESGDVAEEFLVIFVPFDAAKSKGRKE